MAENNKQDATPDKTTELEARIEALEAHIAEQDATLAKLQEDKIGISVQQAKPKPKLEIPQDTFTVSRQAYQFTAYAFIWEGEKVLAKDALKDKALLKKLVESGSTVVAEV